MKHITTVNEFFGFSASEKAEKQKKLDIDQLKQDIMKYNWGRAVAQPAKGATNQDYRQLVKIRLESLKSELPLLYKLSPALFEFKEGSTNAVSCRFISGGQEYDGIIPHKFSFLIDPKTHIVASDDATRQRALSFIISRLEQNY